MIKKAAPKEVPIIRNFTGIELAKAHLLHLTHQEAIEYLQKQKSKSWIRRSRFFAAIKYIINPGKLFFIRFKDERGIIIMAENEIDACIRLVPFLIKNSHSCQNPRFNQSCTECQAVFDNLAMRLNNANITWLGWAKPKYNSVIWQRKT